MSYSLGLDVGSVNAKLVLINELAEIIYLDVERIASSPKAALRALILRLSEKVSLDEISSAGVSGTGKAIIPRELGWSAYSSPLAIAQGTLHFHSDAGTIIQIGGQSSLVIELEDGLRKPWKVASNPLCAAGTGRFLEQQAYRLGISLEDFSHLALEDRKPAPRIAARCSVFAKTDLIHMQQKGVPVSTMLHALCDSVARQVVSFKKGKFQEPICFTGGVAANAAVLRSLNEALSARNGHEVCALVPQHFLYLEALGSALLARQSGKSSKVILPSEEETRQRYQILPPLERVSQLTTWTGPKVDKPFIGYLGVDVGSTSTKAVVLDESGRNVVAKHYLMTAGRPLEAVKEVFRHLLEQVDDNCQIAGVGVTGSGRYLVGGFIGADLIKNEITAQARAAAEIDPEADIIEIGGQDSKLVIKRRGVVVDYQMNKACAAGTGSFIDELAEMLNVTVKDGQFAQLAFQAPYTIDLGTRCASFMGQAVASAQQEGIPLEVITASLANSIAGNYLSKVVEHRKLGDKVILTGAVFYNDAVVSAFKRALKGRQIIVPEHKEVSGAIGAALLAREEMKHSGKRSKFKGFRPVIEADYQVKTFVCHRCPNNCTISRLQLPGEKPTFYGSRCDLFDSTISRERLRTAFDVREELLFKDYREGAGKGLKVGIPRALLIYDYAPLFIGFLNALGVKVVLSGKTNGHIMEKAIELSYTDTCFPMKLLHGHVADLADGVDFLLFPSFIRLGPKEGEEDQKYACPLNQAAPFIIRQALGLGDRLLVPLVDLSHGPEELIRSLTEVAKKMGFSKKQGREAALEGLAAQRRFEQALKEQGKQLLEEVHRSGKLGVVLFARAYMSQDSGANLGIAEKLAQLDVVPIPLDFLPLSSVNVKEYSDRPYWMYESKYVAAAALTASDPQLFGLALTNFGCGPNAFILNLVQDIMGGKPLGQLEIDEHAAEAGIVTRLEAFVDTIAGFARSGRSYRVPDKGEIYRAAPTLAPSEKKKTLIAPRMCAHIEVVAAAMEAFGVRVIVLPPANERNLIYSNQVTSGEECLPYRVTLGDFLRFFHENGDVDLDSVELIMAGAYGPCRLGKYALEQGRILREFGFDLPIRTTISNNAYRDLGLGSAFERLAWKGIVAVDCLQRLLWHARPYEKIPGAADKLFGEFLARLVERARRREEFDDVLKEAAAKFNALIDPEKPKRPLVGINGEIFLRSNSFSNSDLVRTCEEAGLEVIVSPFGEWIKYISYRNLEDRVHDRQIGKTLRSYIKLLVQIHDERKVAKRLGDFLGPVEPSIKEILSYTEKYLSPKCGSEAVLSIGAGVEWLKDPRFAGVISVMPHGCMPGGIVAAMAESLGAQYGKPWISLTYDGTKENNNLVRINNFAELLRFTSDGRRQNP